MNLEVFKIIWLRKITFKLLYSIANHSYKTYPDVSVIDVDEVMCNILETVFEFL